MTRRPALVAIDGDRVCPSGDTADVASTQRKRLASVTAEGDVMQHTVRDYQGWLLRTGRSWNTVRAYRPRLAAWIDYATDNGADWRQFDPTLVARWSQTLAPGAATRGQVAAAIAAAAEWQGADRSAGEAVQKPRGRGKPRWRGLDRRTVTALLDACGTTGSTGTAFMSALYLGLRVSEVVEMRWEDIDLDAGRLVVHREKVDDWHVLPIHPQLAARLEPRALPEGWVFPGRNGGHVVTQTVRDWFAGLCEQAGVKRVTPHQLRHTAAVALYEATNPRDPLVVQRYLGHANIQTTMTYLHVAVDAVDDALSRVTWGVADAA